MSEIAMGFMLGCAFVLFLIAVGLAVFFWWNERNKFEIRTVAHWDEEAGCLVAKITPEQLEDV